MNQIRHLLVHVNDERLARQALGLGVALARQHGASVTALLAVERLTPGVFFSAETAALTVEVEQQHSEQQLRQAQALVQSVAQQSGLAIDLQVSTADPVDSLIRASTSSDLLLVSQAEPGGNAGLDTGPASRLLLAAGCPVLFVPHIGWLTEQADASLPPVRNVLAAWSATRESARALRDAMPLLQRAQRVELVHFVAEKGLDEPASAPAAPALEAVTRHLQRHGVEAVVTVLHSREPTLGERLRRPWTPDASVAEALLSHAADTQADCLVMGGYGHPRAWELVLGGVTRTMLESMTVPVFMSH